MIKKKYIKKIVENPCGGKGTVVMNHWLEDSELPPNALFMCTITMPPGSMVGEHSHTKDTEIYVVQKGNGMYCDNGTMAKVTAGDILMCYESEKHSLENTGNEDLVFNAVIIKAE